MIDDLFPANGKKEGEPNEDKGLAVPFDALKTYLAEVSKCPLMTREKEHAVSLLAFDHKDPDAARELVTANLRLVVKIALGYYGTYLNLLDLIQEGNYGILRAVKKYNPHRGTKFSSYASYWIRAYMLKYIMDSWSMVKIGTTQGQRKLFFGLKKETRRLEALGIYPEPHIIATSLQVEERDVEEMQQRVLSGDLSLETPAYADSDDTVMDTLRSNDDVFEIVNRKEEKELFSRKITNFRDSLNVKAAFIFDHRIMSEEPQTLQEIAIVFNISRERVRQIERKILGNLKEHFIAEAADSFGLMKRIKKPVFHTRPKEESYPARHMVQG
ncbi:MAG TPA: RNA polymerase factor sigma-32 [Syntrophorhabdaceae bacterium]|jgi:RNA polymerase sigma-32 factor